MMNATVAGSAASGWRKQLEVALAAAGGGMPTGGKRLELPDPPAQGCGIRLGMLGRRLTALPVGTADVS
jgi:hypothetical protein